MDPVTIAAGAIAFLAPYLIETGKELSKGLAKDLWTGVKNLFSSDKDKELLNKLKDKPDDTKVQGAVEYVLAEKLEKSEPALKEISEIVEKLKVQQKNKSKNIAKIKGDQNTVFQDINPGRDFKPKIKNVKK